MEQNGENNYGVTFGRIMFLETILDSHSDIIQRHDDIIFEVERDKFGDQLTIVCLDDYTASLEVVMRVLAEFPETNIIYVGGKWNGYTSEAREFCEEKKVGIYNAGEIAGGLHRKEYWNYEKFDEDGNSLRAIKG